MRFTNQQVLSVNDIVVFQYQPIVCSFSIQNQQIDKDISTHAFFPPQAQNLKVCAIDDGLMAKLKKFRFRKEKNNAAIISRSRDSVCVFLGCIKFDVYTVKPLIVDPPRKGHCIKNLSTVDSSQDPRILFPYSNHTI